MSKKLFIFLLSLVFVIGGIVTLSTAVYFSPFNEVKRGLSHSAGAETFSITVTQTSEDVLVNKKVSSYENRGENYFVTEKLTTLNSDVFSSDNYIINERDFTVKNDFSPSVLFVLKKKYFKETHYENLGENFTTFTAKVKEDFCKDFLKLNDCEFELSDATVSIALYDGAVSFLEVSFLLDNEEFKIGMEFSY